MGMDPLMIAVQQGPQLFDLFQQAVNRFDRRLDAAIRILAHSLNLA